VAVSEIIGGFAIGAVGLAAVVTHGNPGGVGAIGFGGVLMYSGYRSLKHSASAVSADFQESLAIFQFEQHIVQLSSEVNPNSVRDYTPEQLSEAKLAANSILQTGYLPSQIADQLRYIIAVIDAEFKRREKEAKKEWCQNSKGDPCPDKIRDDLGQLEVWAPVKLGPN
jgi:hypothetical protein